MKTLPYQLSLTAVNIAARGAYFLVFVWVGNVYGSTQTTDAVFLMYAPVAIIATVIAGIAEIVFMPFAYRARDQNCATAFRRLLVRNSLFTTLALGPLALILAFLVLGKISIAAIGLLPIPALAAISGIYGSLLNAHRKFRTAALGPICGASVAIIVLIVVPISELGLVLAFLAYDLGRAASMYVYGRTVLPDSTDTEPQNAPVLLANAFRGVRDQGLGSLLVALNPLVDMLFAKTLGPGAVSSVEYANRMWVLIPLLFSGPLIVFHSQASLDAIRGRLSLKDVHREAFRLGVVALTVGMLLILAAPWLVDWLYGWGHMEPAARDSLSKLLVAYFVGTGPYVASLVFVRTLSATAHIAFITQAAVLSVILNAGLDWLLIQYMGLAGLGLATSLTYTAVAIFLYVVLRHASVYSPVERNEN